MKTRYQAVPVILWLGFTAYLMARVILWRRPPRADLASPLIEPFFDLSPLSLGDVLLIDAFGWFGLAWVLIFRRSGKPKVVRKIRV